MAGALVALEGIDQAGKLTQARAIQVYAQSRGISCALRHYPDYQTPVGQLVGRALRGEISLSDRARTMLFAANRWEKDAEMRKLVGDNALVLVDRYSWSNVIYGLAQGYDEAWLRGLEAGLLEADLTLFLDIPAAESARRKSADRDGFERDMELLRAARSRYTTFARQLGWAVVDATQAPEVLTGEILAVLQERLADRLPGRLVPIPSQPGVGTDSDVTR